jgi:hypothetical protein
MSNMFGRKINAHALVVEYPEKWTCGITASVAAAWHCPVHQMNACVEDSSESALADSNRKVRIIGNTTRKIFIKESGVNYCGSAVRCAASWSPRYRDDVACDRRRGQPVDFRVTG